MTYEKYQDIFLELASAKKIKPEVIRKSTDQAANEVRQVILAMGQIFNDLQVLFWIAEKVAWASPFVDSKTPNARLGQVAGYGLFVQRQIVGIHVELLELISKRRQVFDTPYFQNLISRLPAPLDEEWSQIYDAALDRTGSGKFRSDFHRQLVRIRGTATYHYYDPEPLQKGLERHFQKSPLRDLFVSIDRSPARTRFFFSDAAVEGFLKERYEELGIESDQLMTTLARPVYSCIRQVLILYLMDGDANIKNLVNRL